MAKSAAQALDSAPSNDEIDFTVKPVIESSLKRYEPPGKGRKRRPATQVQRPLPKGGLPAKPIAPLGLNYRENSVSSNSSTEGVPLASLAPIHRSNSLSNDGSLRHSLSAMEEENRLLNDDLRYIKDFHEKTLAALHAANVDVERLRDERRALLVESETAMRDVDHYRGRLRVAENERDRCSESESGLKHRLNLAHQAIDSYRKTTADYKLRLFNAEQRLREVNEARLQGDHIEEGEVREPEVAKPHNDASITRSSTDTQIDVDRLQAVAPTLTEAFLLLDKITSDMLKESNADSMLLDGPMRKKRKLGE